MLWRFLSGVPVELDAIFGMDSDEHLGIRDLIMEKRTLAQLSNSIA